MGANSGARRKRNRNMCSGFLASSLPSATCRLSSTSLGTQHICLIYLPQGRGGEDLGKKSQAYCYAVKQGEEASIAKIAAHIGRHRNKDGIHGMLGKDAALVPMPRSAPIHEGALWPARMLAEALVGEGLGAFVLPLLERDVAVRKSSTAAQGTRPRAADHLRSFRVLPPVDPPNRIVIVDDVVTSGATRLAAISAVFDAIPGLPPEGFALFRTQSRGEPRAISSPVRSHISLLGHGGTRRDP